jgi:hypothetical protein
LIRKAKAVMSRLFAGSGDIISSKMSKEVRIMEDKKGLIFTIVCIAGFIAIFIFVPRLVHDYGVAHGRSWGKGIGYLTVALAWWFWTEICLYIKNHNDID